ncbi:MAG: MBL fold metallo-hydrolase [Bacteroidales bacterium]|jgi:glyoxylase-like metal-dependent hydrolase (beta-lactamase superfamily II)|nr:MBL fold metallo-hydrolase [Bacteroidales bacterium]
MITNIKTIVLGGLAGNCYLIKNLSGYILIDTGDKSKRKKLEKELLKSGCTPENLKLILLTHGDFDHTGNCAYLKEKYHTKVAMHFHDEKMVKNGRNYSQGNSLFKKLLSTILKIKTFNPDFNVDEGFSLMEYGINARILYLPGHSKGSIGVLTDDGDLFCGDLLTNNKKPQLNRINENKRELISSLWKLKNFFIHTVYPGHGVPFPINSLER